MARAKGYDHARRLTRNERDHKPMRPWRMLAISLVLSLLFGLAGMGEPLEDALRVARNKATPVAASGDIVVVKIDDASQRELGTWPWPRSVQAETVDRLTDAGARKILSRLQLVQFETDDEDDQALRRCARALGPGRPARSICASAKATASCSQSPPAPADRPNMPSSGVISLHYNYRQRGVARALRPGPATASTIRSFAAILAGVDGPRRQLVPDQLSHRSRHHPAI